MSHISPYVDTFYNVKGMDFLRDVNRIFRKFTITVPQAPLFTVFSSREEIRIGFGNGSFLPIDVATIPLKQGCTLTSDDVTIDDDFLAGIKKQVTFMALEMHVNGIDVKFKELVFSTDGVCNATPSSPPPSTPSHPSSLILRIDLLDEVPRTSFVNNIQVPSKGNATMFFGDCAFREEPPSEAVGALTPTPRRKLTLVFDVTKSARTLFLLNIPKSIIDTCKDNAGIMRRKGIRKIGFLTNHNYSLPSQPSQQVQKVTRKELKGSDLIAYDIFVQAVSERIEITKMCLGRGGLFKVQFKGILNSIDPRESHQSNGATTSQIISHKDFASEAGGGKDGGKDSFQLIRTHLDTSALKGEHLMGDACMLSSVSSMNLGMGGINGGSEELWAIVCYL